MTNLREKIEAYCCRTYYVLGTPEHRAWASALAQTLIFIEEHEWELVARIEALGKKWSVETYPAAKCLLDDVLALFKPAIEEPLCPTIPENRDTTAVACGASDTNGLDHLPDSITHTAMMTEEEIRNLYPKANIPKPRDEQPVRDETPFRSALGRYEGAAMKIRTKSGEIIDLAQAREDLNDPFRHVLGEYGKRMPDYTADLLDALEAALSVRLATLPMAENSFTAQGFIIALEQVRKSAGVVEEEQ